VPEKGSAVLQLNACRLSVNELEYWIDTNVSVVAMVRDVVDHAVLKIKEHEGDGEPTTISGWASGTATATRTSLIDGSGGQRRPQSAEDVSPVIDQRRTIGPANDVYKYQWPTGHRRNSVRCFYHNNK